MTSSMPSRQPYGGKGKSDSMWSRYTIACHAVGQGDAYSLYPDLKMQKHECNMQQPLDEPEGKTTAARASSPNRIKLTSPRDPAQSCGIIPILLSFFPPSFFHIFPSSLN
jgi:hypothetical protein